MDDWKCPTEKRDKQRVFVSLIVIFQPFHKFRDGEHAGERTPLYNKLWFYSAPSVAAFTSSITLFANCSITLFMPTLDKRNVGSKFNFSAAAVGIC